MATDDYKTTRIWTRTLTTLRMLHAITGESIVSLLDRLANQELERVQQKQQKPTKREQ